MIVVGSGEWRRTERGNAQTGAGVESSRVGADAAEGRTAREERDAAKGCRSATSIQPRPPVRFIVCCAWLGTRGACRADRPTVGATTERSPAEHTPRGRWTTTRSATRTKRRRRAQQRQRQREKNSATRPNAGGQPSAAAAEAAADVAASRVRRQRIGESASAQTRLGGWTRRDAACQSQRRGPQKQRRSIQPRGERAERTRPQGRGQWADVTEHAAGGVRCSVVRDPPQQRQARLLHVVDCLQTQAPCAPTLNRRQRIERKARTGRDLATAPFGAAPTVVGARSPLLLLRQCPWLRFHSLSECAAA